MRFLITAEERARLYGLPYLQQLIYYTGIRPYMDFHTGVVGIKRGISYQSLQEELFITPHPGIQGGKPSRDQIKRALKSLVPLKNLWVKISHFGAIYLPTYPSRTVQL